MLMTVVAVVCQTLASQAPAAENQPVTVCHEEIVAAGEMPMQACFVSQAAVADWQANSRFQLPDWTVARIRCIPGNYVRRDAI